MYDVHIYIQTHNRRKAGNNVFFYFEKYVSENFNMLIEMSEHFLNVVLQKKQKILVIIIRGLPELNVTKIV